MSITGQNDSNTDEKIMEDNMDHVQAIQDSLKSVRSPLVSHELYKSVRSIEDLHIFTQYHVFAVWDFMSLLKCLQTRLTTVSVPWIPKQPDTTLTRLINEIVLGEESDQLDDGSVWSHFQLYLAAMRECGANTSGIDELVAQLAAGNDIREAMNRAKLPAAVVKFVETTWSFVEAEETHIPAAAFTFGREDLIPEMFCELVESFDSVGSIKTTLLIEYLKRHIHVDAETHSPLAHRMIETLCGEDQKKWDQVLEAATVSLQARKELWDEIVSQIRTKQLVAPAPVQVGAFTS
jgi:hypothetical protein